MYFMYVHFDIHLGGNPADRNANLAYTLVNILYYGIYAFIFLFLSPYMLDNGFNNSEIGMMMAAGFIVSVFLQQIIANFADSAKKVTVSEILAAGFVLIIAINVVLLMLSGRSMLLCVLYCAQIITIMSVQPCLNAMNFQLQNYRYHMNYGIARSMGSLSYAVVSAVIGQIIGGFGNSLLQYGVILLGICLILLLSAMDLKLKRRAKRLASEAAEEGGSAANASGAEPVKKVTYLQFIRSYRTFMIFVAGCTLLFYSYATLNNYLYQVMQPLGATSADYGNVQGFKAAIELFPMILSLTLVMKFGINKLLVLSSFCFFIKSLLTLLAGSITQIWIATSFQMISYGLFFPVAVYYVAELFDKHDGVKGQSLITMAYAIGCVISSLAGGLILNSFGAKVLLTVSTTASLIGAIVTILSLSIIDRTIEKKNPMFG
ncbi:MAG: MFS transporter [Lachnospiraceae bacterium]|nr:MFS transporter [Lachnospiraceae bacterium]